MKTLLENKAEGFPQTLYAFSLLNIELYDCKYTKIKMTHKHEIQCTLDISRSYSPEDHKSHPSPAWAGHGRPLCIQSLSHGRFGLNILLQSSAMYRESIAVRSQHNSRVVIWN